MSDVKIESLLRETAAETQLALGRPGDLPPFEPNSNKAGVAVATVLLVALIAVGGWLVNSATSDPADVQTAETPDLDAVDPEEPAEGADSDPSVPDEVDTVGRVVDLDPRAQPDLDQPGFGESYVDPVFGTTITRATDASGGERIVPVQSPAAVWNADETLLLLYRTGGDSSGHVFLDADTYEVVGELAVLPTDIEQVFWHPTEPDLVVLVTAERELVTVSATTGAVSTIATFPECDSVDPGVGTAGPSWDGTLIALRCFIGDDLRVLSQPLDGTQAAALAIDEGEQGIASPDGQAVIVETATGFDIYDAQLTEQLSSVDWLASAPTVGLDANGNATIVSSGYEADFPALLSTSSIDGGSDGAPVFGEAVQIIVGPDTGYPFPAVGARISAAAWDAPGIFVAASPLPSDAGAGAPIEVLAGEVVLANTTLDPAEVQRLAHTRNTGTGPFSEAYVAISPSGRFIAFASDFGGSSTDTYIIDLDA